MKKTLLLDLDHTLIRPKHGRRFPKTEDDWEFMPGVIDALRRLAADYDGYIVSNQGGIVHGHTTAAAFAKKAEEIMALINEQGGNIRSCVFSKTNDEHYRKPGPGMLEILKSTGVEVNEPVMVGDMDTDREFAKNIGARYVDIKYFLKKGLETLS